MDRLPSWTTPPGLVRNDHDEPSVFLPESLLREARRQRELSDGVVPPVCLLDPDGDVVRFLERTGRGQRSGTWACYHTDLWETAVGDHPIGVVGRAVGAPFAVLVAEELFASGCTLVVSVTSAGQLDPSLELPATILVDRAMRGEGTSYAYLPPAAYALADLDLLASVAAELSRCGIDAVCGGTWTTDAPFRETRTAIAAAVAEGLKAIEMETAALYALSHAIDRPLVCFALVTNQMAQTEGDFEKGPDDGAEHALALAVAAWHGWQALDAAIEQRDDQTCAS